jgi:hypothetical protein
MNFKNYLKQVHSYWKQFYYFTIIFILGTFISAFVISQTVAPFYIYSMYSYVFPKESTMSSFIVVINGKNFNTFSLLKAKGDIIRGNVSRFTYLKNNDYYDKLKIKIKNKLPSYIYENIFRYQNIDSKFIFWLKFFLESETNLKIKNLKIYSIDLVVSKNYKPLKKNQILVLNKTFDE